MAVRPDEGFTGNAEPLQMHLMADAVAGAGKIQAVLFAYRLDIAMVVGVFKAGLQGIVIDIRDRSLGLYARHAHGFKFQVSHGTGGVLCQGLVDLQTDFAAGNGHVAADQMRTNQLLRNGVSHGQARCRRTPHS